MIYYPKHMHIPPQLKRYLLVEVRLTNYFVFFIIVFGILSYFSNGVELDRPALTLFSVNSFLYGFYISPIIAGQRARIEDLHKLVRIEAGRLYEIALYSKRVESDFHRSTMQHLNEYTDAAYADKDTQGEAAFKSLMKLFIDYKGDDKDSYKEMLKAAFAIQQNRSEINMLLTKRVYKNEWMIMLILFSITIAFVLMIDLSSNPVLFFIPAILCAGLSMLIVILVKMSTLTHKRAATVWDPLNKLVATKFYEVNP